MNQNREAKCAIALVWAIGGLVAGTALAELDHSGSEMPADCCFENTGYTGVCRAAGRGRDLRQYPGLSQQSVQ